MPWIARRPQAMRLKRVRSTNLLKSLALVWILSACAFNQTKENALDHSKKSILAWQGKALIFDKVKDKKNTVSLEVVSRRPKNMRMDISAILGVYVGSFVWNENQMQILLAREKKFIVGPANVESMQEILKLQIEPVALFNIFWDEPLSAAEWNCELDQLKRMKLCRHRTLAIQIVWQERDGRHRLIEIDSAKINTQLSINEIEEDTEIKASTFQLKLPEGFKLIRI